MRCRAYILTLLITVLTGTVLAFVPQAMAARGIIITKPTSGSAGAGRIAVISTDQGSVTVTEPGDTLRFSGFIRDDHTGRELVLGDLIGFDIVRAPAGSSGDVPVNFTFISRGTVISSRVTGGFSVDNNDLPVIFISAPVDGKITVNGGILVATERSSIHGNIQGTNRSSIFVDESTVHGNFLSRDAQLVRIGNSTVTRDVKTSNVIYSKIINNRIKGDIESTGDGNVKITNSSVDGQVIVKNACFASISGNTAKCPGSRVIIIEGTPKTPTVSFDPQTGFLEIKGRSIPENSIEFCQTVLSWLDKYSLSPLPSTTVSVQLQRVPRDSSDCLLQIFKKLEAIHKAGTSFVSINWYYEQDDEDMLKAGEDYQAIINVPFKMIEVAE